MKEESIIYFYNGKEKNSSYELHTYSDTEFPIIFHKNVRAPHINDCLLHWHPGIEFLLILEGKCRITSDNTELYGSAGELAVINSYCLHSVQAIDAVCVYYCLIIDRVFIEKFAEELSGIYFEEKINDKELNELYKEIAFEISEKKSFYKSTVKSLCLLFISHLASYYKKKLPLTKNDSAQLHAVKDIISYFYRNYNKPIKLDFICAQSGFSKYHFCRFFKEITGCSLITFLNRLRCQRAMELLQTGRYNVGEAAELCGFNNQSYFSKTYCRYIGILPKQTRAHHT